MKMRRKKLIDLLTNILGSKRLTHSHNVAKQAEKLARKYAPDLAEKSWVAGLLHDHAKKMKPRELIQTASDNDIEMSMLEIEEPGLLHGKVGAVLLDTRFGVDDSEIAQAVSDHVTGKQGMGLLSQVLFVADQIADDRSFAGVKETRRIAKVNLKRAVWMCAQRKLKHVVSQGKALLPETVDLYNSLLGNN